MAANFQYLTAILLWQLCGSPTSADSSMTCVAPHSSVCVDHKFNLDLSTSEANWLFIAVLHTETYPSVRCPDVHYLAGLERTPAGSIRTTVVSRRFDAPVGAVVVGVFFTVLVRKNPHKAVAIPGVLGVCELKRYVAVVAPLRRAPRCIRAAMGLRNLQRSVRLVLDEGVVYLGETAACQCEK